MKLPGHRSESRDAREALAAALESWNSGDLEGYLALYDEGVQLHGYAPEPMGIAAVRGFYEAIFATFDSPQLEFDEVLWDGDERCAVRFTMRGRHVGEFLGVAATGREIVQPGITIMRFEGGRVVERHSQADMLGVLVQIGGFAPPAP